MSIPINYANVRVSVIPKYRTVKTGGGVTTILENEVSLVEEQLILSSYSETEIDDLDVRVALQYVPDIYRSVYSS